MDDRGKLARFDRLIVPHLSAAYNLARWLTRNDADAEDVTQEACVRAFRFLDRLRGDDARSWLLSIVRNSCYTWLEGNRRPGQTVPLDEVDEIAGTESDPETITLQRVDQERVTGAIDALPTEFREVIVLRELEGMSYREIAEVTGIAIGTVMSRLARARRRLLRMLDDGQDGETSGPRIAGEEVRHGV